MSECDNCKNKKNFPCPNTCGYMGTCDGYEPKPKTNADRIRSMTDEELAEWVWSAECSGRAYGPRGKNAWLDWLRQEAQP